MKRLVVLIVAVLMVFSLNAVAKTKKIHRVGVYPLIKVKGGLKDADTLKKALEEKVEDVKMAFEKAESGFLYDGFMEQVRSGAIKEIVVPKGQQVQWMVFRVGKKIKVQSDLEWAANKTLDAFALTVPYECKEYVLIIPKPCGNLTLIEVKNAYPTCDLKISPAKANIGDTITMDMSGSKCATKMEIKVYHPEGALLVTQSMTAGDPVWKTTFQKPGDYIIKAEAFNADGVASSNTCEAKVYINFPPECDLKVEPTKPFVGNKVKMDASGSKDPDGKDGKVVQADFFLSQEGKEVDKKTVTGDPLVWERKFKKPGKYDISLKVTDDFGAVSGNKCNVELQVYKRFFWLVDGGPMLAKGTYSLYGFGRLGFAYFIVPDKLDVMVSAGGAVSFGGERFKHHFLSNLMLNLHFEPVFIGAGLGFNTKVRDDWDSSLYFVGSLGVDVFKNFNSRGAIFGELRMPLKSGLKFDDAHQILLGFRLLF